MLFSLVVLFVPAVLTAKCCGPSKFSSNMHIVGGSLHPDGTPNLFEYDLKWYFDYDAKMGKTEGMFAGKNQMSIIDYTNNVTYTVYDGVCTKSVTGNEIQSPCIPDDAQFVGSQIMGSPNSSLVVNTWRVTSHDVTMKTTVTNDTCTAVQQTTYGNIYGAPGEVTHLFFDITEGALPNGVFNIPPECSVHVNGPQIG